MEYVQKAIELARKEREKNRGEEHASEENSEEPTAQEASPTDKPSGSSASDGGALSISYSASRQVELDPDVLLKNRVVAAFDDNEQAEQYRQLRTQILKEFKKNSWRTLAITGAHPGAGKTLTAINTAITLAKEVNQTVLLVDLDFKGPSIAEVLGLEIEAGLVEYLQGEVLLQDVMINPGFDRLVIVPALRVVGPTSEILSSPRMKETLREMIDRYEERIIIFDLPPLLRDDDALVFTPAVDATMLVVERGVTKPDEVERCMHLLKDTNVIGTVLNKAT